MCLIFSLLSHSSSHMMRSLLLSSNPSRVFAERPKLAWSKNPLSNESLRRSPNRWGSFRTFFILSLLLFGFPIDLRLLIWVTKMYMNMAKTTPDFTSVCFWNEIKQTADISAEPRRSQIFNNYVWPQKTEKKTWKKTLPIFFPFSDDHHFVCETTFETPHNAAIDF